jgi:hypothetical protein
MIVVGGIVTESHIGRVLRRTLEHATHHLDGLDAGPVGSRSALADLRRRLDQPLPDGPSDAETVIDELVERASDGVLGSAGGRFFGWVIGGAFDAGYVFVRHHDAHRSALTHRAAYLSHEGDARDAISGSRRSTVLRYERQAIRWP